MIRRFARYLCTGFFDDFGVWFLLLALAAMATAAVFPNLWIKFLDH